MRPWPPELLREHERRAGVAAAGGDIFSSVLLSNLLSVSSL